MTKFEDIFDFQDKYKYLAHIKDNREETLQEHTELANKYFEKIVEYKNLKPFFERIKNILNLENQEEELYYKNGQLMGIFSNDEDLKFYYDDGNLIMTYNDKTGESIIYHENGNPLMTVRDTESAIYNENNEMLFKVRNGEAVDIGATLKNLDDGSFELVKDNKVVAKVDANGEIVNYLYSTGETLMRANDVTAATEIFFKNGTSFFKAEGNNFTLNYKDGKPLYKLEGDNWEFYNEEVEKTISNFEIIADIKKID